MRTLYMANDLIKNETVRGRQRIGRSLVNGWSASRSGRRRGECTSGENQTVPRGPCTSSGGNRRDGSGTSRQRCRGRSNKLCLFCLSRCQCNRRIRGSNVVISSRRGSSTSSKALYVWRIVVVWVFGLKTRISPRCSSENPI